MKLSEIGNLRLLSQQIESSKFKSAKDLVGYMGAIQAQDYAMAKWAVGLRLKNSTDKKIEKAVHKGEIIRTHLMRPTWHFVSADDIHWMLELTAPQMRAAVKTRHKYLGLTEKIISKSNSIIEKSLRDANHLTREELMQIIAKAKIPTRAEISIHIMYRAEIDGIVCSGKLKNNKQTYALLAERAPEKKNLLKDEALALLAKKYFTSHCPATLKDFTWWSGLSSKDTAHALEIAKHNFISEKIGNELFWLTNTFGKNINTKSVAYLLPAYDEFLISYKDRTASLPQNQNKKVISMNGIFLPSIIVHGKVRGSWKRIIKPDNVHIQTNLFDLKDIPTAKLVEKSIVKLGEFWGKKIELTHSAR